jgi:hypothetical protein
VTALAGRFVAALMGTTSALLVAAAVWACAAAPTPAQQIDLGFWAANDAVCVKNSTTREQAEACMDANRVAMCSDGGILADSGGCADVRLSDGGRP